MKGITVKVLVSGALMYGVAAQAHHSFTAMYHGNDTIEIEGQVIQFLFRNPHSFVHVMATDADGNTTRWNIEWGGASILNGGGVAADTLKRGDMVIIRGNPGRNPDDHRIRMRTLERVSDGFTWGKRPGERFN